MCECDIAHRRSVAAIICNPMRPLNGAQPGPYVPVLVTCGALVASVHLCDFSLQNLAVLEDFYSPLSVLLERSCNPVFDGVGLAGFESRVILFIGLSCSIPTIVFNYFSISLLSVYRLVLWGWGLQTDRVYITLFQPCTADLFK